MVSFAHNLRKHFYLKYILENIKEASVLDTPLTGVALHDIRSIFYHTCKLFHSSYDTYMRYMHTRIDKGR